MNDAQTSGGLLIFVPQEKKDKLLKALDRENISGYCIGNVTGGSEGADKQIAA